MHPLPTEIMKKSNQSSCLFTGICYFLSAAMVLLPALMVFVSTTGQAETGVNYRAVPPFNSTNVKPNVLLMLDNSNSMDEDVDGAAVGSDAGNSKSEIARNALKTIIDNNNATMRLGLMAYKQSGIVSQELHNSFYYCDFASAHYNPYLDPPTPKDPSTNKKRFPNPTDTGNFIYYDTALPYYNGVNDGTAFCYSQAASHTYKCYHTKTGNLATPANATPAQQTASGYADWFQDYTFGPTDSDIAAGFTDFGVEMSWVHIGKTWFSNTSPGPGFLHSRIGDSDAVHITELKNLLGKSQFVSAINVPLRNAGLTPLAGTVASAKKYFQGTLPGAEDSTGSTPISPIQYHCQQNFVVLVTDGLPSVKADGTVGSTADLIAELKLKITALRATAVTGFTDNFDIKTYVIGFAIPPELGSQLNGLAIAGGTDVGGKAILANTAADLAAELESIFLKIGDQASSGTASSVISGSRSGEGAVYQSVFYPEYTDNSGAKNKITWVGAVHASFVDALGHMREDTNGNRILDINDKIVVFRKLADKTVVIDKYSLVDSVAQVTDIILPAAASLTGKFFYLPTVSGKFYVWYTVDGSGADPRPARDMTGIAVAVVAGDLPEAVATKTAAAIDALGYTFDAPIPSTSTITITNVIPGVVEVIPSGAPPENAGVLKSVTQPGMGETEHIDPLTGTPEDIQYLWNSSTWLNGITDSSPDFNITTQRDPYTDTAKKRRYIFTFIDANQNRIAGPSGTGNAYSTEQRAFAATSVADLGDSSTIFPYIPLTPNSKVLPAYLDIGSVSEITRIVFSSPLPTAGQNFLLNSVNQMFYVWFTVNGSGTDPLIPGRTAIPVVLTTSDTTASKVATKVTAAINSFPAFNAIRTIDTINMTHTKKGSVTNTSSVSGITISVTQEGTDDPVKRDEFLQTQTRRVINYIRGEDQGTTALASSVGTIPAFRSRMLDLNNDGTKETTWRLGDIVYSSPTVVSKPQEALHLLYKDETYGTFADKYKQRRTVIYTGANDGMLHAFNGGFYEDRFDVYPIDTDPTDTNSLIGDGIKDAEFLLQPKDSTGNTITSGYARHDLGSELWAYIPYNLLPHLYWLADPNYGHVYYVDLKPRIFDAKIFTDDADHPGGWGTVLVGGMRLGGGKIAIDTNRTDGNIDSEDRTMSSAYFVLDITNPEAPPRVLGEINFPELGYTTCYPTVAAIKDKSASGTHNDWFLIFGSGPAEADGSPGAIGAPTRTTGESLTKAISKQKGKLYVVDLVQLATNKALKTLNTAGALTVVASTDHGYYKDFTGDKNAFISDPITVDLDLDYRADAVYFGTVSYDPAEILANRWGGKMRRIVMDKKVTPSTIDPTDTTSWNGNSVLMDLETTLHQPITAAATIGVDPEGNNWVYFGTGRYFTRDDALITDQETFYGIKEPRSAVSATDLKNSYATVLPTTNVATTLFNSTNIEVNTSTKLVTGGGWSGATWGQFLTDTKAKGGWYYNFDHDTSLSQFERNVSQAALFGELLTFTSYIPSNDFCLYEGSSSLYGLYYLTGTASNVPVIGTTVISAATYNSKKKSLGPGLASKPSIHVGTKDGSTAFVQNSDGSIIPIQEANPGMTKSGRSAWSQRE